MQSFVPLKGLWLIGREQVELIGKKVDEVKVSDWKQVILTRGKSVAVVEFSPSKQVLRERWKKEWKYQKLSRATAKALLAKPAR
ncbi:MAG: hypothetical protein JST35_06425 [Armatimonadetes bacterium]|nr:hypothetical protein [Armatimonadota bacterium]